jgi:hypothetical protein
MTTESRCPPLGRCAFWSHVVPHEKGWNCVNWEAEPSPVPQARYEPTPEDYPTARDIEDLRAASRAEPKSEATAQQRAAQWLNQPEHQIGISEHKLDEDGESLCGGAVRNVECERCRMEIALDAYAADLRAELSRAKANSDSMIEMLNRTRETLGKSAQRITELELELSRAKKEIQKARELLKESQRCVIEQCEPDHCHTQSLIARFLNMSEAEEEIRELKERK